jgi:hypothetical protein
MANVKMTVLVLVLMQVLMVVRMSVTTAHGFLQNGELPTDPTGEMMPVEPVGVVCTIKPLASVSGRSRTTTPRWPART